MRIRRMLLKNLNRARYNPRRDMSDSERADLRNSIRSNGYIEPIVVNVKDDANIVVSGHQRLSVMEDMNIEEVDVSVVELDPTEERELNIALNRIKGDWDSKKLANMLDGLSDRMHLGFTSKEIDELIKSADKKLEGLFDKATELHELEANCTCPCCGHKGNDAVFGNWHSKGV